jgi:glycosyltransferase involved in cell wall biosynthesis
MNKTKGTYIAEINLPSFRAYNIHVMKMINSLNFLLDEINLIILNKAHTYKTNNIRRDFMLSSLKKINIYSIFKKKIHNNFISRIIFGYNSSKMVNSEDQLIITRSFFCSFFLIINKRKHFLEIHQQIVGLTYFIFIICKKLKSQYIIKTIFISKSLANFYKNNCNNALVLADGVDIENFKKNAIKKRILSIYYIGSFYEGRGIDLIINIAKKFPGLQFVLVGKRQEDKINFLNEKPKNIIIKNFIPYYKVPEEISRADILLMPYKNEVFINSKGKKTDISNFMSPIKMFEYLASGKPIISSNLKVLREILIHKKNCILINKYNDENEWTKAIENLIANKKLMRNISKNAIITAKNNTWLKRSQVIFNYYNDLANS